MSAAGLGADRLPSTLFWQRFPSPSSNGNRNTGRCQRSEWSEQSCRMLTRHFRSEFDGSRYHILTDDLRAARRGKGWPQKTLANRVGTSAQAIMRLEKGIGSAETLRAAMDAIEYRLTGIGSGRTLSEQLCNRRMKRLLSLGGWSWLHFLRGL